MLPVIIGIVVVIVIACAIAGIYNNMVTKRNRIDNACLLYTSPSPRD